MFEFRRVFLFTLIVFTASLGAMEPQKPLPDRDAFVIQAQKGITEGGLNYWLKTKKLPIDTTSIKDGRTPLGAAARSGQLDSVKLLLRRGADVNIADNLGLTPLAWAAIQLNKNLAGKREQYQEIVKALLEAGANVFARDKQGISILHVAAGGGNPEILALLFKAGIRQDVNAEGSKEKGRTPIGEVVRASKDALVHVQDFESQDFSNAVDLEKALEQAIDGLNKKVANKLSVDEMIAVITMLKGIGAEPRVVDALGNTLDYYINEVQLITENERQALLKALGLPDKGRAIRYTQRDLPLAIERLQILDGLLQQFKVKQKVQEIIWTIQAAQREQDSTKSYNILRLAMALISKLKEDTKEKVQNIVFFKDIEQSINDIRTILRDAALTSSGKAEAAISTVVPASRPVVSAAANPKKPLSVVPSVTTEGAAQALLNAATAGNVGQIDALLNAGIDPNSTDKDGNTVLLLATLANSPAAVERLLAHRLTDPDKKNKFGVNPLISSAAAGNTKIVAQLIGRPFKPATIDTASETGSTPLMVAAGSGHIDVVRMLLNANANRNYLDNSGGIALDYAARHKGPNTQAIIGLLKAATQPQPAYIPAVKPAAVSKAKENVPPTGILVTEIENQSDAPVTLSESAGRNWEKLVPLTQQTIDPARGGKPVIVQLNIPLDPYEGMADLSINSKLGDLSVEVTKNKLELASVKSGIRPLAIQKYKKARIVVNPTGYIELNPAV